MFSFLQKSAKKAGGMMNMHFSWGSLGRLELSKSAVSKTRIFGHLPPVQIPRESRVSI